MTIDETIQYIPLIGVLFYTVLIVMPQLRRGQDRTQTTWLLLVVLLSIVWEFSLYLEPQVSYPVFALTTLLLSTLAIGGTTAVYLEKRPSKTVIVLAVLAVISVVLVNALTPYRYFTFPDGTHLLITNGTLITYMTWFGVSGLILARTWREYKNTPLPWHANRLLFWCLSLSTIFLGELLIFTEQFLITAVGQIIRFIGVVWLAYGVSSYRIFDVRTQTRRTIAFIIINLLSALPLILIIYLIVTFSRELQQIDQTNTLTLILLIVTVTVGFFLYDPYRNIIKRVTYKFLGGEVFNTNQAIRNYSQASARTLDVQQLSILVIGTLSELIETNRGSLMLVTKKDDGSYELETIPAMGTVPRDNVTFAYDDNFIAALSLQHQPLLQYDIDFNPLYGDISSEDRGWLKRLEMEVYIPVSDGSDLDGIIAIGPKSSGVPYQSSELDLMQTLADQTVVALHNARLYSELNGQNERIRHLNEDLVDQNEKLEVMDRVKSDFITIASHELRTPLTQVKGYTDILAAMNEENALTREQTREIVGHVDRATRQLETLITAMLDASQLDVDGMQLTFVKTQIDTVVRLAMEPLAQALRERRIALHLEGIEELPPINADFKRMVQAFTNMLGNAVKYTPDGGHIYVIASLVPSQITQEEFIEIIIRDTGIGIDARFHELIFEKFFRIGDPQLHSTGSTKFKGAGPGLGLPIAKGVIEGHGGRIWVESEGEDEARLPGTSFHIIIPVNPPNTLETLQETAASKSAAVRPSYLVG